MTDNKVVQFRRKEKLDEVPQEKSILWFKRSEDTIFPSIEELYAHVRQQDDLRWVKDINPKAIGLDVDVDIPMKLGISIENETFKPTHWAFGQICQLIGYPASHYRKLPASIMAPTLLYGIMTYDKEFVKVMGTGDLIRSITQPNYSRILDAEVVATAARILKDSQWSVPIHSQNQGMNITSSDRDLFIFMQREDKSFEIDGSIFTPAIALSNSEVGARPFLLDRFYFVNDTRMLIGERRKISHITSSSKLAAEIISVLDDFLLDKDTVIRSVSRAKNSSVGRAEQSVRNYISRTIGFSDKAVNEIEGVNLYNNRGTSLWDISQSIAQYASKIREQNDRLNVERKAGSIIVT